MQLKSLSLLEWCQFQDRRLEFGPGLNAIIGPNGSGKSNILVGLRYALTGVITNEGKQDANIRQNADPTSAASVTAVCEHNGTEFIVRRWLRPDRESVLDHGSKTVRGDKKINAWIADLLGVDFNVLSAVNLVGQRDVFGFIDKKAAARAAAFARLFQTEVAEHRWAACGQHLSKNPIPVCPGDPVVAEQQLAELRNTQEACIQALAGQNSQDANVAWRAASERHRQWADASQAYQAVERLKHQQQLLCEQLAGFKMTIASKKDDAGTIQDALDRLADKEQPAITALATRRNNEYLDSRRLVINKRIAESDPSTIVDPPRPDGYRPAADISHEVDDLALKVAQKKKFLDSFTGETAQCPTCGTHTDALRDVLDQARRDLPGEQTELERLRKEYQAARVYEHTLYCQQEQRGRMEREMARLRQELAEVPAAGPVSELSEAALLRIVDDAQVMRKGLAPITYEIGALEVEQARVRGELDSVEAQLRAYGQVVQPTESGEQLMAAATELQNRLSEVLRLENQLAATDQAIAQHEEWVATVRRLARQTEMARAWTARVQRVRDLLHRDAAPRFVTQRNLQRLQHGANQYLDMFAADFRVSASEGMTFEAHFTDGRVQPAERLSGGQQVVLALAVRLALNFLYADLDFLALDEPTAYLDEHHIQGFRPVLARLREFTTSRGFQCILITHERSLAPLFDSVNQL